MKIIDRAFTGDQKFLPLKKRALRKTIGNEKNKKNRNRNNDLGLNTF